MIVSLRIRLHTLIRQVGESGQTSIGVNVHSPNFQRYSPCPRKIETVSLPSRSPRSTEITTWPSASTESSFPKTRFSSPRADAALSIELQNPPPCQDRDGRCPTRLRAPRPSYPASARRSKASLTVSPLVRTATTVFSRLCASCMDTSVLGLSPFDPQGQRPNRCVKLRASDGAPPRSGRRKGPRLQIRGRDLQFGKRHHLPRVTHLPVARVLSARPK